MLAFRRLEARIGAFTRIAVAAVCKQAAALEAHTGTTVRVQARPSLDGTRRRDALAGPVAHLEKDGSLDDLVATLRLAASRRAAG